MVADGSFLRVIFTFHNVSINTKLSENIRMQLTIFTFHNVSINTTGTKRKVSIDTGFTFHNVSINTATGSGTEETAMNLYIPQCFY